MSELMAKDPRRFTPVLVALFWALCLGTAYLEAQASPPSVPPSVSPTVETIPDSVPPPPVAQTSAASKSAAERSGAGSTFTLGPEDVIFIRVMHEPDLTGSQDIRPDGMVTVQLIGELKAAGKTPSELASEIREKLLQTMKNPEVTVQVSKVNSRKFTLQGEVNRPGTYTFVSPVTVLEALVNGQGFRDFANLKKIYILRNGERLQFNYKSVSHGKHMEQNVVVQNGDQIFVP